MSKIETLPTFSGVPTSSQMNDAFTKITTAFGNTLSLDGSTPNALGADLDLNGNDVLNVDNLNVNGSFVLNGATVSTRLSSDLDFSTRALFVTWNTGSTEQVVGMVANAGGLSYRYTGSGSAIGDLPGWVPMAVPQPGHWGGSPGGSVDNTTALSAWSAWLSTQDPGVEGFLPGGSWRHTAPIVFSGVRGRVIRGIGGNVIGGGSRLEYIGTAGDAVNGSLRVVSCLNYEFRDICFINRCASAPYHVEVNANVDPALSSHFVRFHQCSFIDGGGASVTTAGILLASAKFVVLDGCNIAYNGHYGIICGADDDTTIISGALSSASILNSMIFNDIGLYRADRILIDGNSFETKAIDGGTGCIVPLGQLKSSGIVIRRNGFIDDGAKTETRAAITTSSYAGTASLSPGSGWIIEGNSFRNRLTGIDVRGGVRISSNIFLQRTTPASNVGVRINSSVPATAVVTIDPTNDFTLADTNNMVAVEDNRTTITDSVIINQALAVDLTLPAVGSYQTVLTGSTVRQLRGGKYRVTYNIVVLVNSAGAGNYRAQLLIAGTEYDTVVRTTGGNSEYITLQCSRIIKLAASTGVVTCTLRLEQSSGTASLVRALTNGSTFFQIEELP